MKIVGATIWAVCDRGIIAKQTCAALRLRNLNLDHNYLLLIVFQISAFICTVF